MTLEHLANLLITINGQEQVLINEPMHRHTSFKIGGPADILVLPLTEEGLIETIKVVKASEQPYFVMGNGSNLLVSDLGVRGVIIKIAENLSGYTITDQCVAVEGGMLLSSLARQIMAESLEGFEFASGIPGTIGGAVFMNAGAYDGEFKDIVNWVKVITPEGEIKTYTNEEMNFGYRHSVLHETGEIVYSCGLSLKKGNYNDIKAKTDDLTQKRTTKQPLHLPSAGSTFKRPVGYFAGKLIDDAGLRGLRHGGAQISDLHCGFVVNVSQATCQEVSELIQTVQKVVLDKFGVTLETEVRFLGEF